MIPVVVTSPVGENQAMTPSTPPSSGPIAVIGPGRLGTVLHRALVGVGAPAVGPFGRNRTAEDLTDAALVLICVPDSRIAEVAAGVPSGPLLAHCSGASGLDVLAGRRGFSLHPLMTFTPTTGPAALVGVPAAVAGTDPEAADTGRWLAGLLGLEPFTVAEHDRIAYHAATALASNFLITLESAAADLLATAGVDSDALLPLIRATVANWATQGSAALTGPTARGDTAVVDGHRAVIATRTPDLLAVFDALAAATARLARQNSSGEQR